MSLRVQIPVISKHLTDDQVRRNLRLLDRMSVVKPLRMFGASWTSDKVALHKAIWQCPECVRKYDGWWKRVQYRPDWGYRYLGDCDGCSARNRWVTLFHWEGLFYEVLTAQHGTLPRQ